MSRISQTLSLLGNLNFLLGEADTTSERGDNERTITERFLPRRQDAMFGDQFIFQTASLRQRMKAKLVLLAPLPCDMPPFAKSVIYLSSLSGPISATVSRLPGAESHFFRLYIFAREADVKVTLPSLFQGVVNVKRHDGCRQRGPGPHYCSAFRDRTRCGLIRLDSCVVENGDEVYIHTQGRIQVRLMRSPSGDHMGLRVGRHVRRIFSNT